MNKPIRFHWSLSQAGNKFRRASRIKDMSGIIELAPQLALCRKAEENGIDSVLMAIGYSRPDPSLQSIPLALQTEKINFMIAVRTGLIQPTYFVQQVNTISSVLQGRLHINVVGGYSPQELAYYGDHIAHDQRYDRSAEFLEICLRCWSSKEAFDYQGQYYQLEQVQIESVFQGITRKRPEIYVGGNSEQAAQLAAGYSDCLWRFPARMEELVKKINPVLKAGKEVGLLVSLLTRPTRAEALRAASEMLLEINPEARAVQSEVLSHLDAEGYQKVLKMVDGDQWQDKHLWTGAVAYLGAPAIALVGSYAEIAQRLLEYKRIGITQFLFMGWPDIEEVEHFGKGVLPLVRQLENTSSFNQLTSTIYE